MMLGVLVRQFFVDLRVVCGAVCSWVTKIDSSAPKAEVSQQVPLSHVRTFRIPRCVLMYVYAWPDVFFIGKLT